MRSIAGATQRLQPAAYESLGVATAAEACVAAAAGALAAAAGAAHRNPYHEILAGVAPTRTVHRHDVIAAQGSLPNLFSFISASDSIHIQYLIQYSFY